ncbi:cytochrome c-type biogenesis protein CcmH [Demequina sp. TTPB684]|uniref:cytochrome c-type biogenesis protein n=1 Tax=unclassified Demequina TaxID=2620311 RepID=UPI001CF5FD67|nr:MULTISPECIES: cytochrome c-type biogenesis protein [unclassified Demequina]MCB2412545.1 cytochrome c-type biogenesis protein CcmH [Demequina sp. TTPB684]UPU87803.1 cytochrome c-type biogenesis protein CcmH [Demequina sp. TMPB413]
MTRTVSQWAVAAVTLALLAIAAGGLVAGNQSPEDRAYAIEQRLRCPTCKTVSVAESPSETAAGMRQIVAEQVAAGRTDEEIFDYFTQRYGQWVLLEPPFAGQTLLLWLLPLAAAGGGLLVLLTRGRVTAAAPDELSDAERRRVAAALDAYREREPEDDEP